MPSFLCPKCSAEYATWIGACARCGSESYVSLRGPEEMVGRVVNGRYKVLRLLGRGGMGTVYVAEQVGVGNQVALKFLNSQLSRDPDVARRFVNEAKSYIKVAHPNAVLLHDFGQDAEGDLFISMELVEGTDLKKLLAESGPVAPAEAVAIGLQVADVLAEAHSKGIVHRDLKPENVMVRRGLSGFHVKVLDFGIARFAEAGTTSGFTRQGVLAGTPAYMAPEQVRGEQVDARIDVYALGLLLFELVTARQAFEGVSVAELFHQQSQVPVPPLPTVVRGPGVDALEEVIRTATQKDREARYASMGAVAAALKERLPRLPDKPWELLPRAAAPSDAHGKPWPSSAHAELGPTYVSPSQRHLAPSKPPAARGRWVAAFVALLGLAGGAGLWAFLRGPVTPVPVADDCPELTRIDPALARLTVRELEQRFVSVGTAPPTVLGERLEGLRANASSAPQEKRQCAYRTALGAGLVAARATLHANPSLWGQTQPVDRLRRLYLEVPLRVERTAAERQERLDGIEEKVAAKGLSDDGDKEYWRHQLLGLLLLCEASDDGLRALKAGRPAGCGSRDEE